MLSGHHIKKRVNMEGEAGPVLVFIEVKAEACRMWTHSGQANLTLCKFVQARGGRTDWGDKEIWGDTL